MKSKMTEKDMIGKRIEKIEVNGYVVRIVLEDGTCLDYIASDGGYSSWNIYKVNDELYKGLGKAKLITCYQPTIDAVPVVRCKDCKCYKHDEEDEVGMGWCTNFKPASNEHFICWDSWYCGDGQRKDG